MQSKVLSISGLRARLSGGAALIAFLLFVLFAGSNAVAARISDFKLPPFWGAAARQTRQRAGELCPGRGPL